ncbi:MAG: hypothetical protein ABI224_05130 [Acetobacteraceae bacterium]
MLARTEWLMEQPVPSATTSRGLVGLLRVWRYRLRERDGMAHLTERDLRDARLTRADVQAEIAKPFWRA